MVKKVVVSNRPVRDIRSRLLVNTGKMPADELEMLRSFSDFLDRCLKLDPAQRMTVGDALRHPFLTSVPAKAK